MSKAKVTVSYRTTSHLYSNFKGPLLFKIAIYFNICNNLCLRAIEKSFPSFVLISRSIFSQSMQKNV